MKSRLGGGRRVAGWGTKHFGRGHPWKRVYRYERRCSNKGVPERTANPTAKKVNCRGIRKAMAGTWGRIEGAQARALVQHAFTSWQNWGVFWPAGALLSFLPSSERLHLRHLNMSFAGARHFVASKNTFYEAKTVSGMFRHQAS